MTLLEHQLAGRGRPLLLLHAGIADMRMWDPLWEELAERFRVLRCDLRGFGESPVGDQPYRHVDDLAVLLDHAGMDAPAVIGASMGGQVAIELAGSQPERVGALLLAAPALADHEWSAAAKAFGVAQGEALERGDIEAAVALNLSTWIADPALRDLVEPMTRRALELQVGAAAEEIEVATPPLRDLRVPTLALAGDRDLPDFPEIAGRIGAEVPGARAETLSGAGHLLTLERPREFLRRALDFLL